MELWERILKNWENKGTNEENRQKRVEENFGAAHVTEKYPRSQLLESLLVQ